MALCGSVVDSGLSTDADTGDSAEGRSTRNDLRSSEKLFENSSQTMAWHYGVTTLRDQQDEQLVLPHMHRILSEFFLNSFHASHLQYFSMF